MLTATKIEANNQLERWQVDGTRGIVWNVKTDTHLPHSDHVEMSGRKTSVIATYGVDTNGKLTWSRKVIWPMLRIKPDDVRGYLIRDYGTEIAPEFTVNGLPAAPGKVARITFDGLLSVEHEPYDHVAVTRVLFPSPTNPQLVERWTYRNTTLRQIKLEFTPMLHQETVKGMYGDYIIETVIKDGATVTLEPKQTTSIGLVIRARKSAEIIPPTSIMSEERDRRHFISVVRKNLRLETPDPVLNRAFDLAKIRAAESVFETKRGLFHSPGGGRYYGGIWANDQAEYSGPFFPYLADPGANEATLNAYRMYATAMDSKYSYLPSSFEMEGDIPYHAGGDRGDAAMVAYGASRFALARGSNKIALELWPAIEWCLTYCDIKKTQSGVIASDTDELEGRFPTGKANLSTSTLCYGALMSSSRLASDLGKSALATEYLKRASALRESIESYFGANIEGFSTYKYYEGNRVLRSWICLPLVMGIDNRAVDTINALLSPRLWTEDGLATQAGETTFWDRSTLYALRGIFTAGDTERALRYLESYTKRRLLGQHVPYPVEAYPEGDQAHLSAESALYCRIYTEGLFGINPVGLRSFEITPRLPNTWKQMALRNIQAFGGDFDVLVTRYQMNLKLVVSRHGTEIFSDTGNPSKRTFLVKLP